LHVQRGSMSGISPSSTRGEISPSTKRLRNGTPSYFYPEDNDDTPSPRRGAPRARQGSAQKFKRQRREFTPEIELLGAIETPRRGGAPHVCFGCSFPIMVYGRLAPCLHVLCFSCTKKNASRCIRCNKNISKIDKIENTENLFICEFDECYRSYLNEYSFKEHQKLRNHLPPDTTLVPLPIMPTGTRTTDLLARPLSPRILQQPPLSTATHGHTGIYTPAHPHYSDVAAVVGGVPQPAAAGAPLQPLSLARGGYYIAPSPHFALSQGTLDYVPEERGGSGVGVGGAGVSGSGVGVGESVAGGVYISSRDPRLAAYHSSSSPLLSSASPPPSSPSQAPPPQQQQHRYVHSVAIGSGDEGGYVAVPVTYPSFGFAQTSSVPSYNGHDTYIAGYRARGEEATWNTSVPSSSGGGNGSGRRASGWSATTTTSEPRGTTTAWKQQQSQPQQSNWYGYY